MYPQSFLPGGFWDTVILYRTDLLYRMRVLLNFGADVTASASCGEESLSLESKRRLDRVRPIVGPRGGHVRLGPRWFVRA